jgi:ribosomal protein S1
MVTKEKYSDTEFETLLTKFDYNFKKGDLIKGTVWSYDSEGVIVDIGSKTSAIVPTREAKLDASEPVENVLVKGKEYEFLIIKEEDEEGRFLLSRKKVDLAYTWKELEKIKEADEVIMGTVSACVKGGILVEILGVRGFVPSSHLRNKDSENSIGDKIELKILTLDSQQNNFILSNKKVFTEQAEDNKKTIFSQIEVGQVLKGDVVRIADFGAFIDIGGVDGLLPLSQISWRWVDHPSDMLKVGDKIDVEVIGVDHDKHRVSLSLKNLEVDPWIEAEKQVIEGEKREGTITRIKHFGAFVEIFPGVEALLPHNELLEYQNTNSCILQVGDKINTVILKFNPTDKRIALSVKDSFEAKKVEAE